MNMKQKCNLGVHREPNKLVKIMRTHIRRGLMMQLYMITIVPIYGLEMMMNIKNMLNQRELREIRRKGQFLMMMRRILIIRQISIHLLKNMVNMYIPKVQRKKKTKIMMIGKMIRVSMSIIIGVGNVGRVGGKTYQISERKEKIRTSNKSKRKNRKLHIR